MTSILTAVLASLVLLTASQAPGSRKPEDDFVTIVSAFLGKDFATDWQGLEKLPGIKWAASVTSLQNCLPDGSCYARQGTATLGGKSLSVFATGARTIVSQVYFRNPAAPVGEAAVLQTLKQAELAPELARCPVKSGAGGTNWYRLKGPSTNPGILSIQTSCNGRPCEGFVLVHGERLPALQPNQLALYSEQCAAGEARGPVSTLKPHEQLAETILSLLPAAAGPPLYDWKALAALPTGITWSEGPKQVDLSFRNDPSPLSQTGHVSYAGREFSLLASGTQSQVKTIYFDEGGLHPRGEHLLGVIYEKAKLTIKLVRCGPVYTESTNNWYSMAGPKLRPVMLKQSIRYDGNQVQDSYELRLDGSLPRRDPRDRDPGVNGCR